ncbi:NAD(P)-binding protein [Schizophyllum commune Tattone D]|nr:NAD(P)-binding protein [Schizophyllum commune Tattone D]
MSSTSGIAILGAGIFAKEAHIPALAALGAGAPLLKAVYSRSEKSAKDTASTAVSTLGLSDSPAIYHDGGNQENSLDALLARSDISAVIVILPILTQPDIILKALAAGKHVLSEKPIAPDVDAGVQLIKQYEDAFKPKGLIWRVAENFELENGFVTAAKLVKEGKIGDVISFRATVVNHIQVDNKYYNTPWRTVPQYQGGFLLDGGVHFAAALRTVLGKPIETISSFAALNREILPPHDTIHAIAAAGRTHGNITITFASPTKSKADTDDYVFIGTKGWIGIRIVPDKKLYRVTTKWKASGDKEEYKEDEDVAEVPQGKGVQHELGAFFDAVAGKPDALKVGEPLDALRDVAFIQAALNSDGKPVDLLKLVEGSDNARSPLVAQ